MKAFRFPLERVLHWRRTQLELEHAAMERLVQRAAELQASLLALATNRLATDRSIAHAGGLDSCDLQTLSAYQSRTARERVALVEQQLVLARETAAQVTKNMEAQRRVKLLERLREQKMSGWTSAMDAEQESFAAEAWLGRWPLS